MMHNTDEGYASRIIAAYADCGALPISISQPDSIIPQLRQPTSLSINSINDVGSVVHIMQEDHFTLSNGHVGVSFELCAL